jgi:hypothetical protein
MPVAHEPLPADGSFLGRCARRQENVDYLGYRVGRRVDGASPLAAGGTVAPHKNPDEKEPTPMRSTPIRKDIVNEVSATRLADADGGRRSVAPFRLVRYTAAASAAASAAALGSSANAAIVTGGTVTTGVFQTPAPSSSMAPPVLITPLQKSNFGNALNVKFLVGGLFR